MGYVTDEQILDLLSTPPFDEYPEFKGRLEVFREALTHASYHEQAVKDKFGDSPAYELTPEQLKERMSYCPSNGRMEHLGDVVLEYCTCYSLYCACPADSSKNPENTLTNKKIRNVENPNLKGFFDRLHLERYIAVDPGTQYNPNRHMVIEDKQRANFIEAILGAVYCAGGLHCSMELIRSLILEKKTPMTIQKHITTSDEGHREAVRTAMSQMDPFHSECEMSEAALDWFCEAFTMNSKHLVEPYVKDQSDLVFLGTSVLKLAQAEYFFNTRPYADKGRLAAIRRDVENLHNLRDAFESSLSERIGDDFEISDYIYTNNPDPATYANPLGNDKKARLFKAIIGAYSVAYSYEDAYRFVEEMILKQFPEYDPYFESSPKFNPKTETKINNAS